MSRTMPAEAPKWSKGRTVAITATLAAFIAAVIVAFCTVMEWQGRSLSKEASRASIA